MVCCRVIGRELFDKRGSQAKETYERQNQHRMARRFRCPVWAPGKRAVLLQYSWSTRNLNENLQIVALELSPNEEKHSAGWRRKGLAGLSGA
jgi:hypothetical protein